MLTAVIFIQIILSRQDNYEEEPPNEHVRCNTEWMNHFRFQRRMHVHEDKYPSVSNVYRLWSFKVYVIIQCYIRLSFGWTVLIIKFKTSQSEFFIYFRGYLN